MVIMAKDKKKEKLEADGTVNVCRNRRALHDYEITDRIETMLGLRVKECNITVDDFYFPNEERQQEQEQGEEEEPRVR